MIFRAVSVDDTDMMSPLWCTPCIVTLIELGPLALLGCGLGLQSTAPAKLLIALLVEIQREKQSGNCAMSREQFGLKSLK